MKTVKRGTEVKRVSDAEAAKAVKRGWAYCPKSDWKELRIRSANAHLSGGTLSAQSDCSQEAGNA